MEGPNWLHSPLQFVSLLEGCPNWPTCTPIHKCAQAHLPMPTWWMQCKIQTWIHGAFGQIQMRSWIDLLDTVQPGKRIRTNDLTHLYPYMKKNDDASRSSCTKKRDKRGVPLTHFGGSSCRSPSEAPNTRILTFEFITLFFALAIPPKKINMVKKFEI